MKLKRPRFLFVASIGLCAISLVGLWMVVLVPPAIEWELFGREYDEISASLEQWSTKKPQGINKDEWEAAYFVLYCGFGNVCTTPDNVSLDEMRRLKADIEEITKQPPSLKAVESIWNRLGETGPHGRKYTTQMRPLLTAVIESIEENSRRKRGGAAEKGQGQ